MSRASSNLSLFSDCTRCEAYAQCGGSDTGPCGCVYAGTDRAYDCSNCPYHCRERRGVPGTAAENCYDQELAAGRPLELVVPNREHPPELPLVIPTLCDRLDAGTRLNTEWLGVQLVSLLNVSKKGKGRPRSWLVDRDLSGSQRVTERASPLALLHGDDRVLRAFWGMDRPAFYRFLAGVGVRIVTGPTFSVYADAYNKWPASTSVVMQLHHNRVLEELFRFGFVAAPNIFWRSSGDRRNWASWFNDHPHLTVMSRDFSCTPDPTGQRIEVDGLVEMISDIGRRMHVIVHGVGAGNAARTLRALASVNTTCTFVSGQGILLGRGGEELNVSPDQQLRRRKSRELPRGPLGQKNLATFEAWMLTIAREHSIYSARDWSNTVKA